MRAALALVLVAPLLAVPASSASASSPADTTSDYVSTHPGPGRFPLAGAPVLVDDADYPGVVRVAGDLRSDLHRVTSAEISSKKDPIIVGTIGHSPTLAKIIARGKIDVSSIQGKWETTIEQVVENPLPGVKRAFVIAGSDQRGTIYGAYDLSRNIGVSPWYFWDDVPVAHQDNLYVLPGRHSQGTPAVKYRGFFINDENPDTGTWAPAYFGPGKAPGYPGGLNANYYAKVFETMLRLKANYLWPAVWGRAFAEDDPDNHATATRYGVVMGTSHEAPMMRGIEEWNRHAVNGTDPYGGNGMWSFRQNPDAIKAYWRDGAERMRDQDIEGVITLGMRGNGDVSLPDGDGIDLMSSIIDSQRAILQETGLIDRPQVQTLYKEVQRYWDKGYRPPDDVTVVFCDDNWGNMRKLPDPSLPPRSGGYGMYYHFDYVGGGRNYKWADTANLTNTWEQLHLAYTSGVNRLWVANVGDLKNEELPTQFFLDYAWNPSKWPVSKLGEWTRQFAEESFGTRLAPAIATILDAYGHLQSRRKPELLNRRITVDPAKDITTDSSAVVYDDQQTPFSLTDYGEMDRVTNDWLALAASADHLRKQVPAAWQDAFYQLVYYQVKDTAIVYDLRRAEFTNIAYAAQGRAATNALADRAEALFAQDQAMSDHYNTVLAGGKWKDWQLQPKIGYGNVARYGPNAPWQQPELNNVALPDEIFPYLQRITVPAGPAMGVALDGGSATTLPSFSPWQSQAPQYIDVYNKGTTPFAYTISSGAPWLRVSNAAGTVTDQIRATVTVDWRHAPRGVRSVPITITGAGSTTTVQAPISNPALRPAGFLEANGYVAIEADHYSRRTGNWQLLPGIGRTGNGLAALASGGRLDYTMTLTTSGPVQVSAYLSPRNNVLPTDGLKYAVSIDGETPQVVNVTTATGANDTTMNRQWERNTSQNTNVTTTTHTVAAAGTHTLTFWSVDPTVIVQRLVVDTGGVKYSYLGPPESRRA
ncbi:glycosyl hydrolase 115 family protein [Paractinoplanes globisporus]|uniref:Glycosyl hydrolase 115 family protein n=1 Tax=Paractinoplanes globisporus TaxID=113565 RepID=A0ABW6WW27_9ACTN|nr:glycosyl hydrolase 115 family protein [Actinoplanes globisporus]